MRHNRLSRGFWDSADGLHYLEKIRTKEITPSDAARELQISVEAVYNAMSKRRRVPFGTTPDSQRIIDLVGRFVDDVIGDRTVTGYIGQLRKQIESLKHEKTVLEEKLAALERLHKDTDHGAVQFRSRLAQRASELVGGGGQD